MSNADRLALYVAQWREAAAAGRQVTAAEICTDSPELQAQLELQLDLLRRFQKAMLVDDSTVDLVDDTPDDQPVQATPLDSRHTTASGRWPEISGYKLGRVLGQGSMGVVLQAEDLNLHRAVAIKLIPESRFASASQLARFAAEGTSVARIQHPNVVQVYQAGSSAGQPFLVMEYVSGKTLAERITEFQKNPTLAARVCERLARGLQAAHSLGIVHRDLKPANVLLGEVDVQHQAEPWATPAGVPKIADFGLAKQREIDLTQPGTLLGTPAYMAPELVDGHAATAQPSTDIYALGKVFYLMLAGRLPHEAASVADMLEQVRHEPVVSTRNSNPTVPIALDKICLRCLATDPADRYATAQALAEDLASFLRPASRQWSYLLAASLLILLFIAAVVWFTRPLLSTISISDVVVVAFQPEPPNERIDYVLPPMQHFGSYTPKELDRLKLGARLDPPAYCYLIAHNPDGSEQWYPEREPPAAVHQFEYPPGGLFPLTEGPGPQVFVLLVSRAPLPAYTTWRHNAGPAPWKPLRSAVLPFGIWFGNRERLQIYSSFLTRGAVESQETLAPPEVRALWLHYRELPGIDDVRIVGFSVRARK